MTDTNTNAQEENKNTTSPSTEAKVEPTDENKTVAQAGATTEAKTEEKKAV